MKDALDLFLHLDRTINGVAAHYQAWTYLLLFVIVFCETGLVVTPFLPGDSLLFAAGALAASTGSPLNVYLLGILLVLAAFCGDNVNYFAGKFLGPRLFRSETSRLFRRDHLDRTHAFYERYGGKTIVLARFVPIVRTFAPFVAGLGAMTYRRFVVYSIGAAVLWVTVCVSAGFFFGSIPAVKNNFTLVALAIVFISLLPAIVEFVRHRRYART